MARALNHYIGGKTVAGTSGLGRDQPAASRRARVLMKFLDLINREMDPLAKLLSSEHGKTVPDPKDDIQRGLEVLEFAIGIPHLLKGKYTEGAGITPLNFPAMIPLWKAAPAIDCGNAHK
jgi:malonate-semialdehyde dehydrogenase (acetylating)/methylmalonate-semialdehyde dehydrogenase